MKRAAHLITLVLYIICCVSITVTSADEAYEAYYNYLGNYPSEREYFMSTELQGVAHDDDHWYFTQKQTFWKIPVENPLNSNSCWTQTRGLGDIPELNWADHLGDLDYFEYEGVGFLFVPVEESPSVIAVFDVDFNYIDHDEVSDIQDDHAPWCCVRPANDAQYLFLYSSDYWMVNSLCVYRIDLDILLNASQLILEPWGQFYLRDYGGSTYTVDEVQGGEFSESNTLLYITSMSTGITVFDVASGNLVERSTNGSGYFNFEYHTGHPLWEEPEGLTVWSLDSGIAPNISGQLHVILLDNDAGNEDDIYFKHYTSEIFVDSDQSGGGSGKPNDPFPTVEDAIDLAWDGARITIDAGSYPEIIDVGKRVMMLSTGGSATIGD